MERNCCPEEDGASSFWNEKFFCFGNSLWTLKSHSIMLVKNFRFRIRVCFPGAILPALRAWYGLFMLILAFIPPTFSSLYPGSSMWQPRAQGTWSITWDAQAWFPSASIVSHGLVSYQRWPYRGLLEAHSHPEESPKKHDKKWVTVLLMFSAFPLVFLPRPPRSRT